MTRDPAAETMPARDWSDVPYVRVYYSVLTDPKFATVYTDDAAFAAYFRLLIAADQAWPMPASIPAWLGRRAQRVLTNAGLLIQQGTFYRMSGLDKERQSRYGQGKGRARYPSDGAPKYDTPRSDVGVEPESDRSDVGTIRRPTRAGAHSVSASVSASEDDLARAPARDDPYAVVEAEALQWLARHGCSMSETSKLRQDLVVIVTKFGTAAVIGKFDRLSRAGVLDGDTSGFIWQARDALFPKADLRALDQEDRAAESRAVFERGVAATLRRNEQLRGDA